jgi:hypothetical protein
MAALVNPTPIKDCTPCTASLSKVSWLALLGTRDAVLDAKVLDCGSVTRSTSLM